MTRLHVIEAERVRPRFGKISERPLFVYLPEAKGKFPVLYCQDGQNIWDDPHACFGHGGWYLNRTMDELVAAGRIEPVILVGIPNSRQRYREYSPGKSFDEIRDHPYANFVCDVVKPYIDRHFPTKPDRKNTGLLGSSLGGLVSLWMAHKWPETFAKAACLSGAFQVRDRTGQTFAEFLSRLDRQALRIYLDWGTVRDGVAQSRKVAKLYKQKGWELLDHEQPGAGHNERFWRDRAWRALEFLFRR